MATLAGAWLDHHGTDATGARYRPGGGANDNRHLVAAATAADRRPSGPLDPWSVLGGSTLGLQMEAAGALARLAFAPTLGFAVAAALIRLGSRNMMMNACAGLYLAGLARPRARPDA